MGTDVYQALEVKQLVISTGGTLTRAGEVLHIPAVAGHIGATAGWLTNDNKGSVQLPASQTNSTFVIPISIPEGYIMTGWQIDGQVESAGNNVDLTASLRKMIMGSASITDSEVDSIAMATKTADYLISDSATFAAETVGNGQYYVLLTGTTAATTDIDFGGIRITYTQK